MLGQDEAGEGGQPQRARLAGQRPILGDEADLQPLAVGEAAQQDEIDAAAQGVAPWRQDEDDTSALAAQDAVAQGVERLGRIQLNDVH